MPEIYEYFKEYKPGNTLLTIDDNNNVNLVDNGQLVYDGDPKKLSIEQLDAFAIDPKCFSYGLSFNDNPNFEHEKILKKYLAERDLIPNKNHIEISYQELSEKPIKTIQNIYEKIKNAKIKK